MLQHGKRPTITSRYGMVAAAHPLAAAAGARILSAAFRNVMHWSELVGGDVVLSPPYAWQVKFNKSGIAPVPRMDVPVDPRIVDAMYAALPDFRAAYEPDGLSVAEFDTYGATRRTLRQFLGANNELEALVRDVIVPNPDKA